ncbi:ribonuclease H-like domain-containing protein [Tanacetum coccineum]|uniref:Ribonuclease H-like domain-containing protein n=1 Tax=Tanacetum coccineum TaxID=301880 RepID=A0ABQ5JB06_9ASTR
MGFVSTIQTKNNHKDSSKLLECLLLSQKETQKVIHSALKYPILDKRLSRKAFINQITRSWTSGVTRLKAHKALKGSFRNKKMKDNCYLKLKQDWISRYTTRRKDRLIMKDFAPVARIEAIRLFLAYASFKDFVVYQIDVKSAFLYGKIEKEVYVCQPPGFEDPDFPDRVYKVEKALYGLHQAPRAWYETLSTYLLDNSQDKYVTEILKKFGFTDVKIASTPMETQKPLLKDENGEEVDVHMYRSMIGSLMYLTSSRPDIMYLKGQPKLGLWYLKDSPFDLVAYTDSEYAGASLDRKSTIGGCQFLGCRLISWQCKKQIVVANSTIEAEYVVASSCYSQIMASAIICLATNQKFNFSKYIFDSMVKNVDSVGNFLMYPRFVQVFLDKQVDGMSSHDRIYVTPSHTNKVFRNMKRVGKGFFGNVTPLFPTMMVQTQQEQGEGSAIPTDPQHTPIITQPSSLQPQKKQKPRKPSRKNTEVPQPSGSPDNVADETVYKERDDSLVRAATTASILEAEQDSGGGPRRQDTIGDTSARTRFERVSKSSNDSLLAGVNIPRSDEDRLKLQELMELCTNLQKKVLDLEQTKTTQALEIDSLKRRVKKLEKKERKRTHKLKRLYKIGLSRRVESSEDEENIHDEDMFGVNDLDGDEVVVESEVADKDVNLSVNEVPLAQALAALKSAKVQEKGDVIKEPSVPVSAASTKVSTATITIAATTIIAASTRPRAKGIVFHEEEQATTPIVSSQQPSQVQEKGKGKMVEEELVEKMSKKELLRLDEEHAFKLQAEEEEEERLAREKAQHIKEANIAWDDVQAKIETDFELAQRLQAKEQEELTVEENAILFQ